MSEAKYKRVVVRLDDKEREVLKVLNAALAVSEYTDDVDGIRLRRSGTVDDVAEKSLSELFTTIVGLMQAADLLPKEVSKKIKQGKILFSDVSPMLRDVFEIGRRYKRFNPTEMKEYGKLVMVLQDANRMQRRLDVDLMKPVLTVGELLNRLGALSILSDPRTTTAVLPLPGSAATEERRQEKARAMKELLDEYSQVEAAGGNTSSSGNEDNKAAKEALVKERRAQLERCLRSIDDSYTFAHQCCSPLRKLMKWLDEYFPQSGRGGCGVSIEIRSGRGGSCLSHSHETQNRYVRESLELWNITQRDIFEFWEGVEHDMIVTGIDYRFVDTGQGFHRLSSAPRTGAKMSAAIAEAHHKLGGWVGIKVVHLGDRDVPNALVFIDKYTVIPRLVAPVVHVIESLEAMFDPAVEEPFPGIRNLLKAKYKSLENLRAMILADFFKHAFDGSGDDGGNCIDGRLTSAWNWCSLLHKKDYYTAFTLCGFTGFD